MKYKLLIFLVILVLMVTGCENNKVYLTDKYYNEGVYIDIDNEKLKTLKDETYVLFTYNHFCNFTTPCDEIFLKVMKKYKIDFLSINIDEYKKSIFFDKVRYAPSVLIINKNNIVANLDADSDEDFDKYQNSDEFEKWLLKYVNVSKK